PYLPCDYKVVLVGGGDNLTVYKKIIGELNLINRVFIFESTLEPEKFYQIADVFCLTSTYEPFGQVLIEASFCGLNIVAFDSDLKGIDTATNSIFIHDCDFYFPVSSFELSDFAKEIINAVTCNRSSLCQNEFNKQYNWKALIERLSID
ncbi:glycosyltransferase, partial [Escherichia coli]